MKIAIYKYQLKYFTIRFKINRKELSTVIKITLKIKLHILSIKIFTLISFYSSPISFLI